LWAGVAAASLFVVVMAIATPRWQIHPSNEDKPYRPTAIILIVVLICALLLVALASTASVIVRLRRARGLERQQLRWLASSASLVAVGFALAVFLPWDKGLSNWLRVLPLHLGFIAVIASAGLAVLRYRLYDLDIVVSRRSCSPRRRLCCGWIRDPRRGHRPDAPHASPRECVGVIAGDRRRRPGLPAAAGVGCPAGGPHRLRPARGAIRCIGHVRPASAGCTEPGRPAAAGCRGRRGGRSALGGLRRSSSCPSTTTPGRAGRWSPQRVGAQSTGRRPFWRLSIVLSRWAAWRS
jgi:hypothetical protein